MDLRRADTWSIEGKGGKSQFLCMVGGVPGLFLLEDHPAYECVPFQFLLGHGNPTTMLVAGGSPALSLLPQVPPCPSSPSPHAFPLKSREFLHCPGFGAPVQDKHLGRAFTFHSFGFSEQRVLGKHQKKEPTSSLSNMGLKRKWRGPEGEKTRLTVVLEKPPRFDPPREGTPSTEEFGSRCIPTITTKTRLTHNLYSRYPTARPWAQRHSLTQNNQTQESTETNKVRVHEASLEEML